MKTTSVATPSALAVWALIATLADCGGPQTQIAPLGSIARQTVVTAPTADRGGPWMLPEAKNEDLLYVSGDKFPTGGGELLVFSYPAGKLVGDLRGFAVPEGICSDEDGNVFVPDQNRSRIVEYAHGGTVPINILDDPYVYPVDCAVDPTTGNLAVANFFDYRGPSGNIAIYPKGSGSPKRYVDSKIFYYPFCTYDAHGDLFADGQDINFGGPHYAELLKDAVTFTDLTIPKAAQGYPLLWDGKYFAIETTGAKFRATIYRISISGSTGTIVGTTALTNWKVHHAVQFWAQGNALIQPSDVASPPSSKKLGIWSYPAGGNPVRVLQGFSTERGPLFGVTISRATTSRSPKALQSGPDSMAAARKPSAEMPR